MSKEKQILKLGEQGYSQRKIASILSLSRNTVSLVLAAAKRQHITAKTASTDETKFRANSQGIAKSRCHTQTALGRIYR